MSKGEKEIVALVIAALLLAVAPEVLETLAGLSALL